MLIYCGGYSCDTKETCMILIQVQILCFFFSSRTFFPSFLLHLFTIDPVLLMLYSSQYPRCPRDLNDSYNACMRDEKQKDIVEHLKKGWHFPGPEQLSSVLKLLQLSAHWFMSKSVAHLGHYRIIKVLYIFPFHFYLKKKRKS